MSKYTTVKNVKWLLKTKDMKIGKSGLEALDNFIELSLIAFAEVAKEDGKKTILPGAIHSVQLER